MDTIDALELALSNVLENGGYHFSSDDKAFKGVSTARSSKQDMLFPVLVRLGEEFWRSETQGNDFGCQYPKDKNTLTGYRVEKMNIPFSIALMAIMKVIHDLADDEKTISVASLLERAFIDCA